MMTVETIQTNSTVKLPPHLHGLHVRECSNAMMVSAFLQGKSVMTPITVLMDLMSLLHVV
jgi:hypothetical protein